MKTHHVYQTVAEALSSLGVECTVPTALPEGNFLRIHAKGDKPGSKNVAILRKGTIGYVKSWKTGECALFHVKTYDGYGAPVVTPTVSNGEAAALASRLMHETSLATDSDYFTRKGIDVSSFRLKQVSATDLFYTFGYHCLGRSATTFVVVPAYRIVKGTPKLSTCQLIGGTPVKKHFLKGGAKKGAFWVVHPIAKTVTAPVIGVAEGVATAISAWQLFKDSAALTTVVAAFDCGNLVSVCQSLRKRWSDAQLIVFADNDCPEADLTPNVTHSAKNTGVSHAKAACRAVGARLHAPSFDTAAREAFQCHFGQMPTDWNDFQLIKGFIHATK